MTRDEAERKAGEYLTGKRLAHSLSTARLAAKIAEALALPAHDIEALYIAGALHDIAKEFDDEKQYSLARRWHDDESGASVQDASPHATAQVSANSAIWHAPAAAAIIQYEFCLPDARIARAVARHTTGGRAMTRFDECLYAADFLDPCRPFAEQESVWPLLASDFDEALLAMCRGTIESVLASRAMLDIASVEYYNELIERIRQPERKVDALSDALLRNR